MKRLVWLVCAVVSLPAIARAQGSVMCSTNYIGQTAFTNCALPPPTVPPPPPAPTGSGINPWIPLMRQPAPIQSPLDIMSQLMVLQQAAELRRLQQQTTALPDWFAAQRPPVTSPVPPSSASGGNWMDAYVKGVTKPQTVDMLKRVE